MIFFHRHLDLGRPLLRAEGEPLLLYRWSEASMTSTVDRATLLRVRVAAFERRVLAQPGTGLDQHQVLLLLDEATDDADPDRAAIQEGPANR